MIPETIPTTQTPVQAAEVALTSLEILYDVERAGRQPTADERVLLAQYPGMGRLALDIFPHSQTKDWKSPRWRSLGTRLQQLTTPEDYASLKRSVFTAFYTSPLIMQTLWNALAHFGVPDDAHVFEPGCGILRFAAHAPASTRMTGVELDSVSARIAQALYPQHDVKQGSIASVPLPPNAYDAVIGNVPFADLHYTYWGLTLSLHELCVARALDVLKPGGVMALVVTHFLLDRQASDFRLALQERAAFLGAMRLPDDAFQAQGTRVVADLVFFLKRARPVPVLEPETWTQSIPVTVDGVDVFFNQWLHDRPQWVLGRPTRKRRQHGAADTYTITREGDLPAVLHALAGQLTPGVWHAGDTPDETTAVSGVPIPRACTEGSFFVVEGAIYQVQHGCAVQAMHGQTPLDAHHGKTGRRLAHLIELRDLARAVLWAQTSGQSQVARKKARTDLNRSYDRFHAAYGCINHTVISGDDETGDVRRRMPNLAVFHRDPDAQFVMALEEYEESKGTATKAALLRQDVLPQLQPPTPVVSAEQALLVSLNETNAVDLDLMCERYGQDEETVLEELGDLVYFDPALQMYVDASTYLAGNVRQKLVEATEAGPEYARNVEALLEAQPKDLPPSQIDANPGAPWVPDADMLQFAQETFEVPPSMQDFALTLKHLPSEALWSLQAERFVKEGTAASVTYGTDRAHGIRLLEDVMNGRLTTIYDYHEMDGQTIRTLNEAETVAARDKQRALTEHFRHWLFGEHARTERLVRIYNDQFNNTRRQAFDGAHLTFPGLSTHLTPYHTQVDAVWRILCTGNTLLAHDVGFGKTLICLMAAAKMKQLGLIHKPMFVVLNSTLTQWTRAALQAYPTGKYLMATKDDCTPKRRKGLAGKIATGNWDGIMITHTSFEKLPMSKEYQQRFLLQKIEEYERVLDAVYGDDQAEKHRNFIKRIEKRKAHYEEKLEKLMDKKDDGLAFDELGVDFLFVDEAQYYKNQDTPTKSSGIAGVATSGSDRAFDLGMKLAYLRAQYPARQTVFATATPISNSITEIYTMQQYLDPDGLAARGVDTFDAWLSVFGQQKERYEIAVDGASLKPRVRIDLQNLTDLQQLFLGFTDVRTHADIQLPIPTLAGGEPQTIAVPMSPLQRELQEGLVARYEEIRKGGVPPKIDNALKITGEGRKLALDARLLCDARPEWNEGKIDALCDNVLALWQQTHGTKAAQLIFSDIGVNPTKWGFSFYDAVVFELIRRGIPRTQIARMDTADTDAKKFLVFEQVKRGDKRVVLGSTERMGTGANLQDRLVAVHHVDPPWKPAQIQQREGRLLRQGNLHYDWGMEVYIFRYVTAGSFDAFMWQAMQTKARLVGYIMDGTNARRRVEDIGEHELSYAEVKAIASGNPYMMTLAQADADVTRLRLLERHFKDRVYEAQLNLGARPDEIARLERHVAALGADMATLKAHEGDTHYLLEKEGTVSADAVRARLEEVLVDVVLRHLDQYWRLGTHKGLAFGVHTTSFGAIDVYVRGEATTRRPMDLRRRRGDEVLEKVDELLSDMPRERAVQAREVARLTRQLQAAQAQSTQTFAQAAYLSAYAALRDALRTALAPNPPEGHPSPVQLSDRIALLVKSHAKIDETAEGEGLVQSVSVSASLRARIAARHARAQFPDDVAAQVEAAEGDGGEAPQGAFVFPRAS